MNKKKMLQRMIQSRGKNVLFTDFVTVLEAFGFELDRTRGSHQIYVHKLNKRMISIQCDGKDAKPYQIKQFISMIERYDLEMGEPS